MAASVSAWVIVAIVTTSAACVTPGDEEAPADPCDDSAWQREAEGKGYARRDPATSFNGTGAFQLDPPEPVLVPGQLLEIGLTFHNPDCKTFAYGPVMWECGATLARIGDGILEKMWLDKPNESFLDWPVSHSCGAGFTASRQGVAPNETLQRSIRWNGSYEFWDHAALAAGQPWSLKTFWAAPGEWPLSYGYDMGTSYDVVRTTTLRVEENELNRESGLHPDRCRFDTPTFANMTITASRLEAPAGERMDFRVSYTMDSTAGGCRIVYWTPFLMVKGPAGQFSVPEGCQMYRSDTRMTLVDEPEASVGGTLEFEWSTAEPLPGPCGQGTTQPANVGPGAYRVAFLPRMNGHGWVDFDDPEWPYIDVQRTA